MRTVALLPLAALLAASTACAPADPTANGGDRELDLIVRLMSGSFSSRQQADRDPESRDIRLEMAQIWPARDDGRWLYVEQATAKNLDAPYRQRVYHVLRDEGGAIVSEVYEIAEPARFVGGGRTRRTAGLSRASAHSIRTAPEAGRRRRVGRPLGLLA